MKRLSDNIADVLGSPVFRRSESGQAILALVAALVIPLLLVVVVALGVSCLYVQRQLAQTAADAAAQAAAVCMRSGTCSAVNDANFYAKTLNGFNHPASLTDPLRDTVSVSFPPPPVGFSNMIEVTVQRKVSGLIGWPAMTVTAVARAGVSTANQIALVQ